MSCPVTFSYSNRRSPIVDVKRNACNTAFAVSLTAFAWCAFVMTELSLVAICGSAFVVSQGAFASSAIVMNVVVAV